MKIGILTFHYGINYGGVLQCYALQNILREKLPDADICVINYMPKGVANYSFFEAIGFDLKFNFNNLFRLPLFLIRTFRFLYYNFNISKTFDDFRLDRFNLSSRCNDSNVVTELNKYDIIVVGSDQVWNPYQRKKKTYFLDFEQLKVKKVAYAACSTNSVIDPNDRNRLSNALGDFTSISVRNYFTQDFVSKLIEIKPKVVCDPTLLWDFNELLKPTKIVVDDYIFVYIIGEKIDNVHDALRRIQNETGIKKVICSIVGSKYVKTISWADIVYYDASPELWLNLLNQSSFVLTDSFHGVLFSIKFSKQFIGFYYKGLRSSRFIDLIKRYDLSTCLLDDLSNINLKEINKIDRKELLLKIDVDKISSEKYIHHFLND